MPTLALLLALLVEGAQAAPILEAKIGDGLAGGLVLSGPDGSNVTFDNPVRSIANGTLTAGSGGIGSPGGAIILADLKPTGGSIIEMRVTDADYILLPNGVSTAGIAIPNALGHFGYHINNDGLALNLDRNGGMIGGTPPRPGSFTTFYGQALLTNGPDGNGLEFDDDSEFIATGDIGQVDNYSNLFFGHLHVDPANAGNWLFRHTRSDDIAGLWLDKDRDGVFELSGSFGDTGGGNNQKGELIVYEDDNDNKTVNLAAGDYMIAFQHREGGGGSNVEFRFKSPTMAAEAVVKPGDATQAGLWSYDPGPGGLDIAQGETRTLGPLSLGTLILGASGTLNRASLDPASRNITVTNTLTLNKDLDMTNGETLTTVGATGQADMLILDNGGHVRVNDGSALALGSAAYVENTGTLTLDQGATLTTPLVQVNAGGTLAGPTWPPSQRATLDAATTVQLSGGTLAGSLVLTNPSTTAGSYALEVARGGGAANLFSPAASLRKTRAGSAAFSGEVNLNTIRVEDGSLTFSHGPALTAGTVTVTGGSLRSAKNNTFGTLDLQAGTTTLTRFTRVTAALQGTAAATLIADGSFDLDASTANVNFGGTLRVTSTHPAISGNLLVKVPAGGLQYTIEIGNLGDPPRLVTPAPCRARQYGP